MNAAGDGVAVNCRYCQPLDNSVFSGMTGVRTEVFVVQVESVRARLRPLRASELPTAGSGVLMTFDDGTGSVFEPALPILAAAAAGIDDMFNAQGELTMPKAA